MHVVQLINHRCAMVTETTMLDKAISAACSTIGLASLKAKQREAILKFVGGQDVFISLPTGYGKSLCYTLHPLVFVYLHGIDRGSIVVCVSPLTSLMMEQSEKFTTQGVLSMFVGELQQDIDSLKGAKEGMIELLYISLESLLCNPQGRDMLLTCVYQENLVAVVVDETHCISRWSVALHYIDILICLTFHLLQG